QSERLVPCRPTVNNRQRVHGQDCKAEPATQESGSTQVAPVAIHPEGDGLHLAKQRSQRFRRARDSVNAFHQRQFKQSMPFPFRHAGEFLHHGVCKRIGAPEEVHVFLGPVPVPSAGNIEAGVGRRYAVVCFRHKFRSLSGSSVSQARHASALPTWVRITVVTPEETSPRQRRPSPFCRLPSLQYLPSSFVYSNGRKRWTSRRASL